MVRTRVAAGVQRSVQVEGSLLSSGCAKFWLVLKLCTGDWVLAQVHAWSRPDARLCAWIQSRCWRWMLNQDTNHSGVHWCCCCKFVMSVDFIHKLHLNLPQKDFLNCLTSSQFIVWSSSLKNKNIHCTKSLIKLCVFQRNIQEIYVFFQR